MCISICMEPKTKTGHLMKEVSIGGYSYESLDVLGKVTDVSGDNTLIW